jgi:Tfp pilus assembly protein PilF
VEPLWELSAIYQAAGDPEAAHRELVKAVSLQPSNPATWEQLASYELARHQPRAAQDALRHAERLDRSLPQTSLLPGEVEAQLRQP